MTPTSKASDLLFVLLGRTVMTLFRPEKFVARAGNQFECWQCGERHHAEKPYVGLSNHTGSDHACLVLTLTCGQSSSWHQNIKVLILPTRVTKLCIVENRGVRQTLALR